MNDMNSAHRVIRETRNHKQHAALSLAEMQFVVSHAALITIEKLLWVYIAAASANSTHFNSTFSCVALSSLMNVSCQEIYLALSRLARMGFLQIEGLKADRNLDFYLPCLITLSLPLEGVLVLKKAPYAIKETHESRRSESEGGTGEVLVNLLNKNVQDKNPSALRASPFYSKGENLSLRDTQK